MPFISEAGLNQLKTYQYKSGGYSTLDNYFNPFWELVVEMLPKSLAPNLITLIGFVNMIIGTFIQVYYSPSMTQDIPTWTLYYMGFSIFVYQTLDAIDGKQARRTKSSSPLGQLFDHGCDSFILIFFIITASISQKMDINTALFQLVVFQLFYLSITQQEHHTGILHTHVNNIGSSEIELVAILNQIVAAAIGQESFHSQLLGIELYKWTNYPPFLYFGMCTLYIFYGIFTKVQSKIKVLLEWLPFVILWCLQILCFNTTIYQFYAGPVLINFGIIMATLVTKMIVCTTTKDIFPIFHKELIPYSITIFIVSVVPITLNQQVQLFTLCFLIQTTMAFVFVKGVITQITKELGISCFSIKKLE